MSRERVHVSALCVGLCVESISLLIRWRWSLCCSEERIVAVPAVALGILNSGCSTAIN